MTKQIAYLVEDAGNDRFFIRFPCPHEPLLRLIRTLVPRAERWKAWDPEQQVWQLPLEYMNDVLMAVEKQAPRWEIKLVDELDPPEDWGR